MEYYWLRDFIPPLSTLNISHFFLFWNVSEKPIGVLWGFLICDKSLFFCCLWLLNDLSLTFHNFIIVVHSVDFFSSSYLESLKFYGFGCTFFFPDLGIFQPLIPWIGFIFLSLFFFWDSYSVLIIYLMESPKSLKAIFTLFYFVFLFVSLTGLFQMTYLWIYWFCLLFALVCC